MNTEPRVGSRPWALSRLQPGEALLVEAKGPKTMAQVAADISRLGMSGKFNQSMVVGVELSTDTAMRIIRVTRKGV